MTLPEGSAQSLLQTWRKLEPSLPPLPNSQNQDLNYPSWVGSSFLQGRSQLAADLEEARTEATPADKWETTPNWTLLGRLELPADLEEAHTDPIPAAKWERNT